MATVTAIDYRRTDERNHVWLNPYWISSGVMVGADCEDKGAILFSFPKVKKFCIEQVVLQVIVGFTSNTVITIGSGTLATDGVTTGGDITIVDADEYLLNADITIATAGWYGPTTANTSDWLTAKVAGTHAAPYILTGAATTVPVVYATMTNSGTIAAGTARLHMLITEIPGY